MLRVRVISVLLVKVFEAVDRWSRRAARCSLECLCNVVGLLRLWDFKTWYYRGPTAYKNRTIGQSLSYPSEWRRHRERHLYRVTFGYNHVFQTNSWQTNSASYPNMVGARRPQAPPGFLHEKLSHIFWFCCRIFMIIVRTHQRCTHLVYIYI